MSAPSRPSPEQRTRARAEFFARLDVVLAPVDLAPQAEQAEPEATPGPHPQGPHALGRAPVAPQDLLGFQPWVQISVQLFDAGEEEKAAVLAAHSMSEEAWARADAAWMRALAADLRAGERARADVYAARLAEARGDLAAGRAVAAPTPAALQGTADQPDLPGLVWQVMAKLPFADAPPSAAGNGAGPSPGHPAGATQPVPVWPKGKGKTLALDSESQAKAAPVMPFAGATGGAAGGGAGVVYFPSLTVKQYLSLRGELFTRPGDWEEPLRRYGVPGIAGFRAMEADWEARLAASAELRAEMDEAVGVYARWLRGSG